MRVVWHKNLGGNHTGHQYAANLFSGLVSRPRVLNGCYCMTPLWLKLKVSEA